MSNETGQAFPLAVHVRDRHTFLGLGVCCREHSVSLLIAFSHVDEVTVQLVCVSFTHIVSGSCPFIKDSLYGLLVAPSKPIFGLTSKGQI